MDVFLCLQIDGPTTGELISGETYMWGAYNWGAYM